MGKERLYTTLAPYTEISYLENNDYVKEVGFILDLTKKSKVPDKTALEVCCGAAHHGKELVRQGWKITCLDLNKEMLQRAKKNVSKATFVQSDLKRFNLKQQFSLITILYNSVNYVMSYSGLEQALRTYYAHLKIGGLLVFDTRFIDGQFIDGHFSVDKVEKADVSIARIDKSSVKGAIGVVDSTTILFKGTQRKLVHVMHRRLLLESTKILALMKKVGFETELYHDFEPVRKKHGVFVFVGRKL